MSIHLSHNPVLCNDKYTETCQISVAVTDGCMKVWGKMIGGVRIVYNYTESTPPEPRSTLHSSQTLLRPMRPVLQSYIRGQGGEIRFNPGFSPLPYIPLQGSLCLR